MHRFWMSFYQTHKSVALPQLGWHISKYGKRTLRCGSVSFTLMIFILVLMESFCRGVLFGCGPAFLGGGNEGDDAVQVTIDQLRRDARLMQPLDDEALPLPTMKEARYLAKVDEAVSFTCTLS